MFFSISRKCSKPQKHKSSTLLRPRQRTRNWSARLWHRIALSYAKNHSVNRLPKQKRSLQKPMQWGLRSSFTRTSAFNLGIAKSKTFWMKRKWELFGKPVLPCAPGTGAVQMLTCRDSQPSRRCRVCSSKKPACISSICSVGCLATSKASIAKYVD